METLLIFGLCAAVAYLWRRTEALEWRITTLTERLDYLIEAKARAAEPEKRQDPEPVVRETRASVTLVPGRSKQDAPRDEGPPAPVSEALEPSALPKSGAQAEPDAPTRARAQAKLDERQDDQIATEDPKKGLSFDFEDIFGRRLPIWGGGFALAIAGIFLVRFAIEAGLLTPGVRVIMSFAFGLLLLAAAEVAYRLEDRINDPRVRQALAGAGLATLYGAFYLAGTAYGLIGAGAAFGGLAIVTAAAIGLSFRFGLPSAVIGLVGGFAAPLLVNSDSANVPLLSFYLALVTGGLAWTGQAQGQRWLSYAALAAGLGWGALMMIAGVSSASDFAALGLYLIVLGTVLPAFLHARNGPSLPHLAAGGIATLQMAVLVSDAGFDLLTWGLYLLIGAAMTALGWRFEALRLGTLVASGLGLWLLAIWPEPATSAFALVAIAHAVIFAGVPLVYQLLDRAKILDLAQLSAVPVVLSALVYVRYGSWGELDSEPLLAGAVAALALFPAVGFAFLWKRQQERETQSALILLAPAALLAFAALLLLTPPWLAPVMAVIASVPLLWCFWKREARALYIAVLGSCLVTVLALVVTPEFLNELTQLGNQPEPVETVQAMLRWLAVCALFCAMAAIGRDTISRGIGEAMGVALLYGAIAHAVPSPPLAWIAAIAAIALHAWRAERYAAWATALVISGAWALAPAVQWGMAGALAVIGDPFQAGSAIAPLDIALRMLPVTAGLAAIAWTGRERNGMLSAALACVLFAVTVLIVHSLYKQVFGITSLLAFERYGMGERTVWQAALMLLAYGASQHLPRDFRRPVALGLIAASLAHFVWFTLLLHNPLLTVQHVGPTPVANWLTLAYVTAIGGLWLGGTLLRETSFARLLQRAIDAATMVLVVLLAYSLLRQVHAGSILTSREIGPGESLLISLLGIVLALGFLWWGSVRKTRSWRIGSLVLMLVAVVKVFLVDAAGLEGLLRIASFLALGVSLIGIGWVYSRQLSRERPREAEPVET